MPDYILGGFAILCIAISWFIYFALFLKIKIISPTNSNENKNPVSIIIAARNELNNLKNNIPHILAQEYPNFELIIADDGSTDGSAEWITELCQQDSRVKLVYLDPEYVKMHGKKIALTLAFKRAKSNIFLLTDADCKPASNQWVSRMTAQLNNEKQIVIGYSPYEKRSGFLNKIIRYETLITAMQYLGYAITNRTYMGVGRNLAYTRDIYDKTKGFSSHSHIPAGDDDLFVQEASNAYNTAVCIHPEAYTLSIPKNNFAAWRQQKKRHMWVGKFYASSIRKRLATFPISQFLFLFTIILWLSLNTWFAFPLTILLIKWIPEWIITYKKGRILQCADLGKIYPLLSIIFTLWFPFSAIAAFFAKKPKW